MGIKVHDGGPEVSKSTGADSQAYDVNLSDRDSVNQAFPSIDASSARLPDKLADARQDNVIDFNTFPGRIDISGKPAMDAAETLKLYGSAQFLDFSGLKYPGLPDISGYGGSNPSEGGKPVDRTATVEQFPPEVAIVDGVKERPASPDADGAAQPDVEGKATGDAKAGARVQVNGEVKPNGDAQPEDAKPQTLSERVLEAAKVGKREGYYQVAERLLGKGFDHAERMQLVKGMKAAFKATSEGQQRDDLWKNDKLITNENMESVLNSIKDESLRNRIKERLLNPDAMPEPKKQPQREERKEVPESKPKDKQPPRDRPQEQPELQPRYDTPEGQKKSAYLKRYDEGDSFKGSTSTYWQGRTTASGIPFNYNEMTAASREFPFGTVLKVTNPSTGKEVRVVVTDHGPFAGKKVERPDGSGEKVHSRVLDISLGAANALGMGKTVKDLDIKVEHIPEQGKWGKDRRNIHRQYREDVVSTIRRLNSQRGRYTA